MKGIHAGLAGILTWAACALTPAPALADAGPDAGVAASPAWLAHRDSPAAQAKPTTGPVVVRSLAATALLAGLGAAALFLRKRRGSLPVVANDYRIAVLGSTRVGPKAHAVVASVAGRVLLLGVTDNAVQRLAWLDGDSTGASESSADQDDADDGFDPYKVRRAEISTPSAKPSTPEGPRRLTEERQAEPLPRRSASAVRAPTPESATFRDLLARWSKDEEKQTKKRPSAATIVANTTLDVFDHRERSKSKTAAGPAIEGQARGLAARLQGRAV